ncbi:MAG: DUF6262 family protein [Nocardioides marinisabuli]|uniref:DUF6262 family protein n=1 Tax=Nocardioides marinisabuli TaxID=419476 RepID=UPI00321AD26C
MARLTERAQKRSADSLAAARRAIMTLQARQEPVTPTTVAREAGVSVSYLASHPQLREEIRQLSWTRQATPKAPPESPSEASLRIQLQVATERLREQEVELHRLRRENATLRGEVLELRRANRRRGEPHASPT